SPPARYGHALAVVGAKVVLFGGRDAGGRLSDTWEWDGSTWTPRPVAGPPARYGHALGALGGAAVLFGGNALTGVVNDTWEWNGTAWAQRFPLQNPPPRDTHALATLHQTKLVLFGGNAPAGNLTDTWEWDGTNWRLMVPATSPGARRYHAMAPSGGKVVLFGGQATAGSQGDTWEFLHWLEQGSDCADSRDCRTGYCVDGVCCDSACGGGSAGDCQACNLLGSVGTCTPLAGGTTCRPATGECDPAETCDGTSTACPPDAFKAAGVPCTDDGNPCTADACDGAGACLHPAGNAGTVCRAAVGACDVAETCTGTSAACPADAFVDASVQCRAPSCSGDVATLAANCTGAGPDCPPVQTQPCAPYSCAGQVCGGTCLVDGDCRPADYCSAGICRPKAPLGAACGGANQCLSGLCVDGVCCNDACPRQCEACDVAGSLGTCSPVTGAPHGGRSACASDGSACGGACDGIVAVGCGYPGSTTQCRAPSCSGDVATLTASCDGSGSCPPLQTQACAPYSCVGNLCGGPCQTDGDCAATEYCSAGLCIPKLAGGVLCGGNHQCQSGFCVDDVCCDGQCTGQCEACDVAGSLGTCVAVAGGAPHGGRAACAGAGACQGICTGAARTVCGYPGVETECQPGTCADGVEVTAGHCDQAGSCTEGTTLSCGDYACGATACKTSCVGDDDCAAGRTCAGGACVVAQTDGGAPADGGADAATDGPPAPTDGPVTGPDGADGGTVANPGGGCGCRAAAGSRAGGVAGLLLLLGLTRCLRRRPVGRP
ncbi:MAG: hypothetical protein HY906_22310, partial [Deltaproteobacteria bacterium]|nr:hypothetical protein [Deltaproteobacteria bacterium]